MGGSPKILAFPFPILHYFLVGGQEGKTKTATAVAAFDRRRRGKIATVVAAAAAAAAMYYCIDEKKQKREDKEHIYQRDERSQNHLSK